MLKTLLTGTPIRQDADTIVMQEGDAVATYSRQYYRQAQEPAAEGTPIMMHSTEQMAVEIVCGLHGVLAPVGR
ncbi:hypothetical protein [Cohnella nanjingensis]|uniref:Uncharacterized protein n=1 Tax=Cohnella nanjingensis TaxID=1387779 RepID=A0A7X0RMH2_9BACL|nr:hypothetical protein [Cohnella nanjingensis]MBB6670244.1 hypothetical protein [Cohnella nanjingensis]